MPSKSANLKRPVRSPRAQAPRALSGTVFITRQVHFNSAHRLHNPTKSQAWNTQQYGLCTNPHWHGHNYVLEVTLRGQPDPVTGYIVDLGELKRILTSEFEKRGFRNDLALVSESVIADDETILQDHEPVQVREGLAVLPPVCGG